MRKNFASRAFGPVSLFLLLGSSCSLVYDLSPDQCGSNADCVANFGEEFTCDAGVCTCHEASCMGSAGRGGSSASGGTGATGGFGGTGGDAGMAAETGGASGNGGSSGAGGTTSKGGAGGNGATGGSGDEGGMGGMPFEPECQTHKDCFPLYDDSDTNPRACVERVCVPLLTAECPLLLPLSEDTEDPEDRWNALKSTNAIILGAYAPLAGTALDTIGRNYDLAVEELKTTTRGVYAGSTARRQVVTVLCNFLYSTQDELLVPSRHLMEDLKVPGVVGTMFLKDQAFVWENVARDAGVFMMMPIFSDQELIDAQDDGLIWHMLSGADALSVSYQPLLDMTVDHLRALGSLGATEAVKVAHVKAMDEPFLADTANYLEANLEFNEQSVGDNLDAGLYEPITVDSFYKDQVDTRDEAISRIVMSAPHVVIGSTVTELYRFIIPGVEAQWDVTNPTQSRPFYLVGALGYNDPQVPSMLDGDTSMSAGHKPLYQRILGVNWPAAIDSSVYEDYQLRWISAYGQRQDGYENFYDAMYYLLYGVAAARAPLTGEQIVNGLLRVTASGTNVPEVEVGPSDDMVSSVNRLASDTDYDIELIGAMGPPNWDVFGGRNDAASVWCVNTIGAFRADQLRYDPETSMLQPSDPTLEDSTIGCFPFPFTPP